MSGKKSKSASSWIDPDEAPVWQDEAFERAEVRSGETVIRPASGTLRRRGRPHSASPRQQVTLRLDARVIETFRATGPGWQSRINEALLKAAGLS